MKNQLTPLTKTMHLATRCLILALCLAIAFCAMSTVAFAAEEATEAKLNDVSAPELLGTIINIILDIVLYAGVLVLILGIVLLIFALRQEDSDSKSRATLFIIVGIACATLGGLLQPILSLFGIVL